MKAHSSTKRKPNPERKRWVKRREFFTEVFGSVSAAAASIKCHPNSLRNLDACPGIKQKIEAKLAEKGEVLV